VWEEELPLLSIKENSTVLAMGLQGVNALNVGGKGGGSMRSCLQL